MFISKFLSMAASLTSCMPHYLLRLKVSDEMRELYQPAVLSHNKKMNEQCYFDAGFDLICPTDVEVTGLTTAKINLGVSGSMAYIDNDNDNDLLLRMFRCLSVIFCIHVLAPEQRPHFAWRIQLVLLTLVIEAIILRCLIMCAQVHLR
jgi:hypothetical protein